MFEFLFCMFLFSGVEVCLESTLLSDMMCSLFFRFDSLGS